MKYILLIFLLCSCGITRKDHLPKLKPGDKLVCDSVKRGKIYVSKL